MRVVVGLRASQEVRAGWRWRRKKENGLARLSPVPEPGVREEKEKSENGYLFRGCQNQ